MILNYTYIINQSFEIEKTTSPTILRTQTSTFKITTDISANSHLKLFFATLKSLPFVSIERVIGIIPSKTSY